MYYVKRLKDSAKYEYRGRKFQVFKDRYYIAKVAGDYIANGDGVDYFKWGNWMHTWKVLSTLEYCVLVMKGVKFEELPS